MHEVLHRMRSLIGMACTASAPQFFGNNNLAKGIAMKTVRPVLLCSLAAAALLAACGSNPPEHTVITTTQVVVPDRQFGVIESIQLVQVVAPPAGAGDVAGTPVAPAHSTYQIGVRLNQGGYQVFTQDEGAELRVGEQVRIDHGMVRPA